MEEKPKPTGQVRERIGNPSLGADELNLAEFPLAVLSRRPLPGQKTLEFEDEVFDEGANRTVRRRLIISGADRFGLPTPADSDVLLVLIQLTKERSNFEAKVLSFSRYELIELLRWDHGGSSYRRLEEALQRWTSTTLYYHRAWWDRTVRRWRSKTFHVIETLDLKGADQVDVDESPCSLTWNEVLFQSFQASNLKALDLDTYFRLERPAARQAFRFLDKRFYHSSRLHFDLKIFACEHVGLSREHDSAQLRRSLEPVLKELEQIGFLQPMSVANRYTKQGPGRYQVTLVRNRNSPVTNAKGDESSLVAELLKRGVWPDMAGQLAEALPEAEIRRYIALHDWLLAKKDKRISKNSAGFLAACIANRLPVPEDFDEGRRERKPMDTQGPKPRATRASRPEAVPPHEIGNDQELAALSIAELQELEAQGLAEAKPFAAATYERLSKEGGALFEEVRRALLLEQLKRRGLPSEKPRLLQAG